MKYREIFNNQPKFFRSTRIDLDDVRVDKGFVLTPLFAYIVNRALDGVFNDGPRAISITGPYGSGKSISVLQLVHLFESQDLSILKRLQQIRPELVSYTQLPKVIAFPVIGVQGPIAPHIVNTIINWALKNNDLDILKEAQNTTTSNLGTIIRLIDRIRDKYKDKSLIFIIDELGKHLEYAASHPDENDVYLLQLMAEYADRTSYPGMTLITILHQAFENYSHRLLRTQREEFAKIQGRFEDIAFQLPNEDALKIIGSAVEEICSDSLYIEPVRKHAEIIGSELYELEVIPNNITKQDYIKICRQCAPLNPVVALLLGPLFRHFAQNERSLFSMLASSEPYGFQRFLDDTDFNIDRPKLYGLPELYEYIAIALGSSIYHSNFGHRWTQMETALGRVPDEAHSARDLVRSIGLISLVPNHKMVATDRLLKFTMDGSVANDIEMLCSQSIAVYRRFSGSYRLWDGSDIDIEARLQEAHRAIGIPPLVNSLTELVPPRPITARKHSMQSGTLRWFDMSYVAPEDLDNICKQQQPDNSDGSVYVVIASFDHTIPQRIDLQPWQMVIWTIIPSILIEAVAELAYIRWVRDNTTALRDDDIARREVTEREHDLEQFVETLVSSVLYRSEGKVTVFTSKGDPIQANGKEINSIVSSLCDEFYPKAPRIVNEFVNRNSLSTAATAARNEVLKRMIDSSRLDNLGISGYPPQLPIYLSTIKATGIHKKVNGDWSLNAPEEGSTWFETWNYVEDATRNGYCRVSDLWDSLSRSPYGMRKGLLPVLTIAFLNVNRNCVSIMENDTFIPELSPAIVERLLRNPENYTVHLTELRGTRKLFVEAMVEEGVIREFDGTTDLLSLVRPLVAFAHRLPEFTRNTKDLSKHAIAVRNVLLTAKEPAELLFRSLPSSLNYGEIYDDTESSFVPELVASLVQAVREIADCYPKLLNQIQSLLFDSFGMVNIPFEEAQETLIKRASIIQDVIKDLDTKAIVWRFAQRLPLEAWVESVASVTAKKPPKSWFERDLDEFRVTIALLERKFVHYETIASVYENAPLFSANSTPLRIGITTTDFDFETIVKPSENQQVTAKKVVNEILSRFGIEASSGNQVLLIATELVKAYYNTTEEEEVKAHV